MERKIPIWVRVISSVIVFFSSIGIYASVSSAGKTMFECGNEMARLHSQSGASVAEYYYRLHGEIYASLGSVIANEIAVVLIAGIIIAVWLIYPAFPEHKSQIKNSAIDLKDTTTTEEANANKRFCTQCGAVIYAGDVFCTQCGHKADNSSEG